ncbi:transcriptional regulator, MarR family [Stackebrandtia albiflava]|uniref:Transcriptional regulator, MarR family n=1 Tax=Stackebrandtia albiflava TaxID=406432 RepID=A0A562VC88_9ACTN|nr:MarR family winged helix-turn-helix transcriptional regulator [Stackebrandtia albiflava]TWJ15494.1 transcriptional regulator, MarR family [Stackebrandtia albiflava]
MTEPRWLDDREQCAWRAYQHMQRDLAAALERQLTRDSALSGADYELLVVLSETEGHRLRARELRNAVRWDRSRLAHQVRRMENRGLLRRTECETDARGTMVELTDAGRAAIEAAAPGHVETVRRYFVDLLDAEETATLRAVAERVVRRIHADDEEC